MSKKRKKRNKSRMQAPVNYRNRPPDWFIPKGRFFRTGILQNNLALYEGDLISEDSDCIEASDGYDYFFSLQTRGKTYTGEIEEGCSPKRGDTCYATDYIGGILTTKETKWPVGRFISQNKIEILI